MGCSGASDSFRGKLPSVRRLSYQLPDPPRPDQSSRDGGRIAGSPGLAEMPATTSTEGVVTAAMDSDLQKQYQQ